MNDSKTIAALDVGTGKMQVFIGEIIDGKLLNIVGLGQNSVSDVKKGDIMDVSKAAASAQAALSNAEKTSGARIGGVCLGISGTHIRGFRNVGSANVSGADGIVGAEDIRRACLDAQSKSISDDKVFIHNICCGYYLDGEYTTEPLGKKASHIDAEFYMLYGDSEKVADAIHIVESFGLEVKYLVVNALAATRMVTTFRQRQDGVLVLDIGCGTTDYAFIKHDRTFQAGTIPVGGDHFTNDMSFGLRMSRKNAEKLKRRFGKLILTQEEAESSIWTEGDKQIGDRSIPLLSITKILRARMGELFGIVRNELEDFFVDGDVKEIVIVGGTSRMQGIRTFAQEFFGVPCLETKFSARVKPTLCHPEYAAALGLLDYTLARVEADGTDKKHSSLRTIISKIFKI